MNADREKKETAQRQQKKRATVDTNDLLKRVKRVEIKTKALTNNIFAGEYHSAFKGRGMSFAEVREYQIGDDVRAIDWNVTARSGRPHVKVYEEERELTVMLLIDVSGSQDTGSRERTMRELSTEIAATLAFSAIENNDKIGVIFFSDQVERYIPPKKGRAHTLGIIRTLLELKPRHTRTNIAAAVEYLMRVQKRRSIAFLISDFLDDETRFAQPLLIAKGRHDLVAIQLQDALMTQLPRVGLLKVRDAETGYEQIIDTSSSRIRKAYRDWWQKRTETLSTTFKKNGIDVATIATDGDYVKALMTLFSSRSK